ncbi:hypothetical protein JDN40_00985 [Rhodomicrobium vannielii ATCC 17100]|nr:hypothetical protein [Rhodomicrobium vannielii]MBJ7532699.1 hypothetical protein [Rhodomicrobium vannielii ATCC 17100]
MKGNDWKGSAESRRLGQGRRFGGRQCVRECEAKTDEAGFRRARRFLSWLRACAVVSSPGATKRVFVVNLGSRQLFRRRNRLTENDEMVARERTGMQKHADYG